MEMQLQNWSVVVGRLSLIWFCVLPEPLHLKVLHVLLMVHTVPSKRTQRFAGRALSFGVLLAINFAFEVALLSSNVIQ